MYEAWEAFWLWSSVVHLFLSVWQLICLQLETCLSPQFWLGKCLHELALEPSCVALAWHWASGSTPYGVTERYTCKVSNSKKCVWAMEFWCRGSVSKHKQRCMTKDRLAWAAISSQRSLHSAPIFRLLLKVAVNGTHQCDFLNFCGALRSNNWSRTQDRWRSDSDSSFSVYLIRRSQDLWKKNPDALS